MNTNYLKASAAVLLSFFAIPGNLPTANAQTELTPKCETPTLKDDPACWLKVEGHDNCYVWIDEVEEEHTVTWSGQCQAGKAQGRGKETREYVDGADTRTVNGIGSYLNGKRDEWQANCATSTLRGDPACWLKVDGHDNCYIWIDEVKEKHTVTWSGQCQAGKAQGRGKDTREYVDGADTKTRNGIGSYLNGKRDGRWKIRWPDDNNLEAEIGFYVDGKKSGQWEERRASGSVYIGPYVDGKKNGQWEELNLDGYGDTGPYVDGKRHGQWELRYSAATSSGPYVDGKKNGQWEERWESGAVSIGSYVDGKKHGSWFYWDADGSKGGCHKFRNGDDGEWQYKHKNC